LPAVEKSRAVRIKREGGALPLLKTRNSPRPRGRRRLRGGDYSWATTRIRNSAYRFVTAVTTLGKEHGLLHDVGQLFKKGKKRSKKPAESGALGTRKPDPARKQLRMGEEASTLLIHDRGEANFHERRKPSRGIRKKNALGSQVMERVLFKSKAYLILKN